MWFLTCWYILKISAVSFNGKRGGTTNLACYFVSELIMASWTYSFGLSLDPVVRAGAPPARVAMQVRVYTSSSSFMIPSPFWQLPDWWETQPSSRFLIPNVLFSIAWPFSEALDSFGRKIPKYTFVFYHDELVQWQQNVNRRWERLAGSFEIAALKCTVAWEMAHVWDKVGKGTDNSAKGSA